MLTRQPVLKISPDHLDRLAVIYVRQSTLFQVRENSGSTTRQYDLVSRAEALGWTLARIQVIDQDQGHSGSSSVGRDGLGVAGGRSGTGPCRSRPQPGGLAPGTQYSDWYRLLEICALTDTLVIDEEGVYAPSAHNDRLLLGFKGAMSEAELHWLRSRLQGGKLLQSRARTTALSLAHWLGLRSGRQDGAGSGRGRRGKRCAWSSRADDANQFGAGGRRLFCRTPPAVPHALVGWQACRGTASPDG
jgi:hypothetical protein